MVTIILIILLCTAACFYVNKLTNYTPSLIDGYTIICTVCSDEDEDVPSAPVTFSARLLDGVFYTSAAPVTMNDPPPPAQTGTYTYHTKGKNKGILKFLQEEKQVRSTLLLNFTHTAGGCVKCKMVQNGNLVANQCGFFNLST